MVSEKRSKLARAKKVQAEHHDLQRTLFRQALEILRHMDPSWLDKFRLVGQSALGPDVPAAEVCDIMHSVSMAGGLSGLVKTHQAYLVDRHEAEDGCRSPDSGLSVIGPAKSGDLEA